MRINLNGKKYKYKPSYYKQEDDLNVKSPSYSIYRNGKFLEDGKWEECRFFINDKKKGKSTIVIIPSGIREKNENRIEEKFELSRFRRFKIHTYDFIFLVKIRCLVIFDKITLIRKNLNYILIALIGSIIYFLINHFYDNFLQELINKSNLVQSLIVFLSISSIINIFHPFTLRKEWTIKEIDELIKKRLEKEREGLEHEKWAKKNSSW